MSPLQKAVLAISTVIGLLGPVAATQAASHPAAVPVNMCLQERTTFPPAVLASSFDITPAQAAVLMSAARGQLAATRRALVALPASEQDSWREQALMAATHYGQTNVVAGLLDDGAGIEQTVVRPALKPAVTHRLDPRLRAVAEATGVQPVRIGPALSEAVDCGDEATVTLLLRRGARADRVGPSHAVDMLTDAVIHGNAPITRALLDHHASPCVFDLHARRFATNSGKPAKTLEALGERAGLPAALTGRLTCPQATAHS